MRRSVGFGSLKFFEIEKSKYEMIDYIYIYIFNYLWNLDYDCDIVNFVTLGNRVPTKMVQKFLGLVALLLLLLLRLLFTESLSGLDLCACTQFAGEISLSLCVHHVFHWIQQKSKNLTNNNNIYIYIVRQYLYLCQNIRNINTDFLVKVKKTFFPIFFFRWKVFHILILSHLIM